MALLSTALNFKDKTAANNYNKKKVKQHLDHIEKKTKQYLNEMDRLDQVENETEIELACKAEQRIEIAEKLDHLQKRKDKYDDLDLKVKAEREDGHTQLFDHPLPAFPKS